MIGLRDYERRRARALLLLLRQTGLRISDAAMLARHRVRDGKILLGTRKTGGQVFLPITAELAEAPASLPEPKGGDRGYFFWNGRTSIRTVIGIAERNMEAVFRKAGFARCQPHRFRHTLATEILARGGTVQDVADVLGITPAIAWKHYAKWSQERQERVDRIMEEVQNQSPIEGLERLPIRNRVQ